MRERRGPPNRLRLAQGLPSLGICAKSVQVPTSFRERREVQGRAHWS